MKNSIKKGFISGFIATLVLTMMMIIKGKMGVMPALEKMVMKYTPTGKEKEYAQWNFIMEKDQGPGEYN